MVVSDASQWPISGGAPLLTGDFGVHVAVGRMPHPHSSIAAWATRGRGPTPPTRLDPAPVALNYKSFRSDRENRNWFSFDR